MSACQDQTIKIQDLQTGRDLVRLVGHPTRINALAISPDQSILCTSDDNFLIHIWDLNTSRIVRVLRHTHTNSIRTLAISPDGNRLISGSWDGGIKVWCLETGEILHSLGHRRGIYALVIWPDGQYFATACSEGVINIWELQTGQCVQTMGGQGGDIGALAIAPTGQLLASGSTASAFHLANLTDQPSPEHSAIQLWDVQTGTVLNTLMEHQNNICSLVFSADGATLISGSQDGTIKVWDTASGQVRHTLTGHQTSVGAVALSPDQQTLASWGDRSLKLWTMPTGQLRSSYTGHSQSVISLAISPDGRWVASGSRDRHIKLWDTQTHQERYTLWGQGERLTAIVTSDDQIVSRVGDRDPKVFGHRDAVSCLAFSPDGQYLVSGSWDYTLKLWDIGQQQHLKTFVGHRDSVMSVLIHPDGKTCISRSLDRTVRLWDLATGTCICTLIEDSMGIQTILLGATEDTFIWIRGTDTIEQRNWYTGALVHTIGSATEGSLCWVISRDRQYLVGYGNGVIQVWCLQTGALIQRREVGDRPILCMAISADSKILAMGGEDGMITLYHIHRGEVLSIIQSQESCQFSIHNLVMSLDGQKIFSCGWDDTIRVWERGSVSILADAL
ncbi:MAG: hypothetical protein IGR80_14190 [Synechococcales cyanobacterium K44_A2020_017]|nr:hypothetical protein [Synechococcales cyanobacterium K32_A2020_035]MBF2095895.1 hypothetical protein [Synechococcales cyanobacterium K44_A2020_017]